MKVTNPRFDTVGVVICADCPHNEDTCVTSSVCPTIETYQEYCNQLERNETSKQ